MLNVTTTVRLFVSVADGCPGQESNASGGFIYAGLPAMN